MLPYIQFIQHGEFQLCKFSFEAENANLQGKLGKSETSI